MFHRFQRALANTCPVNYILILSYTSAEKVATTGRVLGDRSVLYKYLNPNALAFATANVSTSTVTLYVMDLVSGAIIYRVKHAQAATVKGGDTVSAVDRMPVYVAQSENWVVYHLWAKQSRERQVGTTDALPEVHVLELYESALPDERVER